METKTCWAQVKEDYCPNTAQSNSDYCEEHADLAPALERARDLIYARLVANRNNKEDGKEYSEEEYLLFALEEAAENDEVIIKLP